MRKNSPRKWLHAVLDLLPVILIPVFMIYSHRHTIDSGTIEVPQNKVVDFNQLWNVTDMEETSYSFGTLSITDHELNFNFESTGSSFNAGWFLSQCQVGHKYYLRTTFDPSLYSGISFFGFSAGHYLALNDITTCDYEGTYDLHLYYPNPVTSDTSFSFYANLFDLTKMFGTGNEPTLQEFNQWYSEDYYDYTLSHKELLKNTSTITYSDTDIMSQFTYQLYNSVDKYFNMGNVFNMTSVYDWFNLNIFGGNAPISIYIVWNIVLYEFVMDLLFLLYGLFMWFIDMVQHLMDKPFKSIK